MRSTRPPLDRSAVRRSTLVGVVAGLTLGGGAVLVGGLPSGLGATGAVGPSAQSETSVTGTDTAGTDTAGTDTAGTDTAGTDTAGDPRAAGHEAHLRDALAPLVDDGTLTESQVDAIVAALADARPSDRGDRGHGGRMGHGPRFDAVAELLGLTVADIGAALRDGQSLADIAAAHGSSAEAVVEVLVADLTAHLDEEVTAGELTQAEADQWLADATERITALVNGELADRRPGPGGPGLGGPGLPGPGMGGPGMGGPGMGGHGPGGAHRHSDDSVG